MILGDPVTTAGAASFAVAALQGLVGLIVALGLIFSIMMSGALAGLFLSHVVNRRLEACLP